MSSLKEQLAQVASNNTTLVLDRKKRQKLHSASLVYNPKTASTQDFDFIFENATSALNDLIEIEPRFGVFSKTLFSESSISIDRNFQTKEEAQNLDRTINAYLILASSKWHLTPTLHATEWLVRRFQIHIHNAETLLLSTINYYQTAIFKRILNIVKLPPLFHPLSSFIRSDKNPTAITIIKLFRDMDFLKLYTNYLGKCIMQGSVYTNQLLFSSCSFVNLIAYSNNDEEMLNSLVPILLETSAKLLASSSVDCQIASHCILVVLATALPLKKAIILAATETILSNVQTGAKKSALATIFKLFQTVKGDGNVDQLSAELYKLFDEKFGNNYLNDYLEKDSSSGCDKFITSYLRALVRYDHEKLNNTLLTLKLVKLEKFELRLFVTDLIHLSEVLSDKSQLIEVFEYLVPLHENLVLNCLKKLGLNHEIFEIRLTTSLFSNKDETNHPDIMHILSSEDVSGKLAKAPSFKEFMDKHSASINTSNMSMLVESDVSFAKMLSLFLESVGNKYPTGQFLSSFFTTLEGRITFLLRILVSASAPSALKLISLDNISKCINRIDKESNVFALVPCLVCALSCMSKNVRIGIRKLLSQISKRPFTKHYFMAKRLYGEDIDFPLLNPRDGEFWLENFLNEYFVDSHSVSNLIIPKKSEKIFLLFWSNQALFIPLPLPKMILLQNLYQHFGSSAPYSPIFEGFINNYLDNRDAWQLRCKNNKTSFHEFEFAVINLISPREKNGFFIDFIINALQAGHEQLSSIVAQKLIKIFPTLKFEYQLRFLQTILDNATAEEQSYDAVETLQSLSITTDLYDVILSKNRIQSDDEITELTKKRRRRSSTNKALLQKEGVTKFAEIHLKKLTLLLESLDSSNVSGSESLLSTLLSLLSDLETLEQDGGLPVLYAQEILASCMINTINSMQKSNCPKPKHVKADVVVSAIRNSPSPQVQNKLLLVVRALASLDFETVLHSVMPIFTFMGTHSIRQDDEFTSHVVENTIRTIVPALLKGNENDIMDETGFLLVSFTTALQHVPKHRRVRLYTTLVEALDPDMAIAPFLILISQQYFLCTKNFKPGEARNLLEFTKSFLAKFDALQQLNGWAGFVSLRSKLMDAQKDDTKKKELELHPLLTNSVAGLTHSELLELVHNGFNFMGKVLDQNEIGYRDVDSDLRIRLYSALLDPTTEKAYVDIIKLKFGVLLENILNFINNIDNFCALSTDGGHASSENDILDLKSDIKGALLSVLAQTLDLLPADNFVAAVLPLLSTTKDKEIRYHLISVINTKFQGQTSDALSTGEKVIDVLLKRIPLEKDNINLVQVSLNTLSSLINQFGKDLSNVLINKSLALSTDHLRSTPLEIAIPAIAVITSCVEALGIKSIAFYSRIIPVSFQIFDQVNQNNEEPFKQQLQLSILLLFAAFIKHIPSILMSDMKNVLRVIYLADKVAGTVRLSIISLIVSNMDSKEILKALQKLWGPVLVPLGDSIAISLFLSTLESTVESTDKKSATIQSPNFFKLLLELLEYRSVCEFDSNTINRIEASIFEITVEYVLKLNDKVFRPLFVIMVRWAFDGEGVVNTSVDINERLISFFKIFNKLQTSLKGIITSYFSYILEPVDQLLKKFVSGEVVNVNLRRLTLNSLISAFKYDKDEYWRSTSRFELICSSLVMQLSNVENIIGKYLVKSIASLAANNKGADDHNKFMHKGLVQHMQPTCSSDEKLWAVRTLKLIYSKVGESWLVLLPQLVPIIAELLEDEDERVEKEVRSGLVKVVENVLGEPFDRYLD